MVFRSKLDKDLTAGVFYIEEIRLVIFTMFSHRKVQTMSVYKRFNLTLYEMISYHLLDLGVGYSVILFNNYRLIMQEKSLIC